MSVDWWIVPVVVVAFLAVAIWRGRARGTGRGGPWKDPNVDDSITETQLRHQNPWRDFGSGGF